MVRATFFYLRCLVTVATYRRKPALVHLYKHSRFPVTAPKVSDEVVRLASVQDRCRMNGSYRVTGTGWAGYTLDETGHRVIHIVSR
jgi:hypothetical protein